MSCYVTGMPKELEEECCAAMLYDNIDISRLMVHAQQIEDIHLRKRNTECKKAKSIESGSSRLTFKTRLSSLGGFKTRFLKISPKFQ